MKFEKITFNFPQEYKRKLEKVVSIENISSEKRITLSNLITDTLIKEFDLKNDKTSL